MSAKRLTLAALVIGLFVLVGCEPSPTELANAADIRARTAATEAAGTVRLNAQSTAYAAQQYATATSAADSAKATAVANEWQAKATDAAWTLSIQATQTAVPYLAGRDHAAATTEVAQRWTWTAALGSGVIVAFLMGLAFVMMVRTRARVIQRGADGQLPGVLIGKTLTDPSRQIGPSVTMPQSPGLLWNVARAVRYIGTGQLLPLPESRVQLTDGNADADHLLAAAAQASQVAMAAAVFRPDNAESGRRAKIELMQKQGGGLFGAVASAPQTRVVITGDSAIEAIAKQLGDRLPPMLAQPDQPNPNVIEGEP